MNVTLLFVLYLFCHLLAIKVFSYILIAKDVLFIYLVELDSFICITSYWHSLYDDFNNNVVHSITSTESVANN